MLVGHSTYRLALPDVSFDPRVPVAAAVAGVLLPAGPAVKFVRETATTD